MISAIFGVMFGALLNSTEQIDGLVQQLTGEEFSFSTPESVDYKGTALGKEDEWSREAEKLVGIGVNSNGTNTNSTENAKGHIVRGKKVIYYKIVTWGEISSDVEEFRKNAAETFVDERGWKNVGLEFVEVERGQDVNLILSDAAHLDATAGCSGDLSCTTWNNEVIINDLRWQEGTEASRAAGMNQRDYQHMVVNHEMGHWLGHYAHVEKCDAGGPAPIMLQQSTGLRGCDSFNAWPLASEWWTLR